MIRYILLSFSKHLGLAPAALVMAGDGGTAGWPGASAAARGVGGYAVRGAGAGTAVCVRVVSRAVCVCIVRINFVRFK